jgi:hypothetical protein
MRGGSILNVYLIVLWGHVYEIIMHYNCTLSAMLIVGMHESSIGPDIHGAASACANAIY